MIRFAIPGAEWNPSVGRATATRRRSLDAAAQALLDAADFLDGVEPSMALRARELASDAEEKRKDAR